MNPVRSRRPPGAIVRSGLAALVAFVAACAPEAEPEPAGPPPNFVLIVADTLRADRVEGADRRPDMTPNLDKMRESGAYFTNAHATSSWTLPSTASIFLSQQPSRHGVSHWSSILGDELTSLPEVLHDAGYRTGGWSANRLITRERGFRQGFDEFELLLNPNWKFGMPPESPNAFASANDLIERALAWLDDDPTPESPAPFFLYLHLMEPHTPFLCPSDAGEECTKAERSLNRRIIASKAWKFSETQQDLIERFYDSDVRVTDEAVGRVRDALAERGRLDDTWFIFTADHGEMLGEHELYVHGVALYQETVRVPLLIQHPGGDGLLLDTPVSLVDVAPTILDAANIPQPETFLGQSLLPAMNGRPLPARSFVAELIPVRDTPDPHQRHLVAVSKGDEKWVLRIDGSVIKFDLARDPGEQAPIPVERSEIEALLTEAGVDIRSFEVDDLAMPELTPEMREHLRGLGYLHE